VTAPDQCCRNVRKFLPRRRPRVTQGQRRAVPKPAISLFKAVEELEASYAGRKFSLDGHLMGSIGEVIAREFYKFELLPMSSKIYDAVCPHGAMSKSKSPLRKRSLFGTIVLKLLSAAEAIVVYDGLGAPIWQRVGPLQSNGQRKIGLSAIRSIPAPSFSEIKPAPFVKLHDVKPTA
jgi:hypothetical protein